jgi:replicative DNA helicase Mcm
MSGQDRSSIHEAIEQQSISIAKAGITATLQSRCALLAAANPKQGRFDEYAPLVEQIELPTTLLTRFDVIFTITDRPDPVTDADMARHILRTHLGGEIRQYRKLKSGDVYSAEDEDDALSFIYPELSPEFLRKYIAYAKKNIIPVMSKDAMDAIEKYYVSLRNLPGASGVGGNGGQGPVTITARQLEAIIRLGEASARVRLSPEVTVEDAERAIRILEYYMQKVATEAGVRDYDYLATGIGHSQRTRIREIMKIIQEFCREDKTGVDLKTILDQAEARGLDRNKVMEDIEKLNIQGDIFKTQKGKYKLSSE